MMGTLATVMAGKKIATPEDRYWADVEGDIEAVNNVLKITRIRVKYNLKVTGDKITRCPAAQSVMNCIEIKDELVIEEMA
jgi:hypothetical protein